MPFWIARNNGLWNADSGADPVAGTNGYSLASFAGEELFAAILVDDCSITCNFGTSGFSYLVPSGYNAGIPASGGGFTTLDTGSATATLSGGNLTATAGIGLASARSADGILYGVVVDGVLIKKFYFEFHVGTIHVDTAYTGGGVARSGFNQNNLALSGAYSGGDSNGGAVIVYDGVHTKMFDAGTTEWTDSISMANNDVFRVAFESESTPPTPTVVTNVTPHDVTMLTTVTLSSSELAASTSWTGDTANILYTVVTPPTHGTLKVSGVAASSFTQADINTGTVTYTSTTVVADGTTDPMVLELSDLGSASGSNFNHDFLLHLAAAPTITHNKGAYGVQKRETLICPNRLTLSCTIGTAVDLVYTVTAGPSHGHLRKGGATVTSFTQADLNAVLVSYLNDGSTATADAFTFTAQAPGTFATDPITFDITVMQNDFLLDPNETGVSDIFRVPPPGADLSVPKSRDTFTVPRGRA